MVTFCQGDDQKMDGWHIAIYFIQSL